MYSKFIPEGHFISSTAKIDDSVKFEGVRTLKIGDHVEIGPDVVFAGEGEVVIEDYTKIFRNTLFISRGSIKIGQAAWIGERCTIDGTGGLEIGNFVGVGIGTCIYTHIQHGDTTEGSKYNSSRPVSIGDDAWFVGQCFVNPVHVEPKSMALLGSVITKDMKYNRTYGGNPAVDLTDKVGVPWDDVDTWEKMKRVEDHIMYYCKYINSRVNWDQFKVVEEFPTELDAEVTYYNVTTRKYIKTNSPEEVAMNKYLFGHNAKFKRADFGFY